jgi:hypothetical protein
LYQLVSLLIIKRGSDKVKKNFQKSGRKMEESRICRGMRTAQRGETLLCAVKCAECFISLRSWQSVLS